MAVPPLGADAPVENRARGTMFLRYEDVAQNGWPKVPCMPHGMGIVAYGKGWNRGPLAASLRARGVIPILSRLKVQSLGGPVSVVNPFEVEAWFQLGHAVDARGQVQRILLNLGADLYAPRARTYDPQPEGVGERILVGRVFAEHVFTRPFASSPEQRRVTSLELDGEPVDLGPRLPFAEAPTLLESPRHLRGLDESFEIDAASVAFGLGHTDSNQHVNSLAYIPLFEDAALRNLAAHGVSTAALQLREIELAYRKPCFAGEIAQVGMQAFAPDERTPDELAVRAYLGPEGVAPERANCMGALTFARAT